jgi:hypothetical protein
MKTVTPKATEVEIRVLKIASCPSLSGKSKLTYQIGCTPKSEVQIRISANSSTGYFNDDWFAFNEILQAIAKVPAGKPVTSFVLHSLFRGRSVNTPSFIFAALKNEGLVRPLQDNTRSYERADPKPFLATVKALVASSVDLKAKDKPQQAVGESKAAGQGKKTPGKSSAKKKA